MGIFTKLKSKLFKPETEEHKAERELGELREAKVQTLERLSFKMYYILNKDPKLHPKSDPKNFYFKLDENISVRIYWGQLGISTPYGYIDKIRLITSETIDQIIPKIKEITIRLESGEFK